MIISRTPFRISFAGGGTDLAEVYKTQGGAVTTSAINKYMYITVNKKFDSGLRISYSKTELVDSVDKVQHPLIREALKLTGVTKGIEVTSMADMPAQTGLGSSSSFLVGLLNALYAYRGELHSPQELAQEACKIEIDLCKEPIGKQDQYIAAYGGLQHIQFNNDDSVFVDPLIVRKKTELEQRLLLFYTGITRPAGAILSEQKQDIANKMSILKQMKDLAVEVRDALTAGELDTFGKLLDDGWQLKKQLAGSISNGDIDAHYRAGLNAGALGGKLLGAGGGGFLLFYVNPEKQDAVRRAMGSLKETTFSFEPQGSKIIYVSD